MLHVEGGLIVRHKRWRRVLGARPRELPAVSCRRLARECWRGHSRRREGDYVGSRWVSDCARNSARLMNPSPSVSTYANPSESFRSLPASVLLIWLSPFRSSDANVAASTFAFATCGLSLAAAAVHSERAASAPINSFIRSSPASLSPDRVHGVERGRQK